MNGFWNSSNPWTSPSCGASGDKASADSMTMDTSRHLHVARMEYRRKQPGIGIYTHVRDSYGLFLQPAHRSQ
jgi:hypothetical protein